jgi:hypothetical protein
MKIFADNGIVSLRKGVSQRQRNKPFEGLQAITRYGSTNASRPRRRVELALQRRAATVKLLLKIFGMVFVDRLARRRADNAPRLQASLSGAFEAREFSNLPC